jgi:very-short-patch-repair endonuclease
MPLPYSMKLKEASKHLRNNMTDAERSLWSNIRMKQFNGYWFYRQKPIGKYIADFYCPKAKLIIEIDGGQHFSGEQAEKDVIRDKFLRALGLKVLRYNNNEVLTNIEGVLENILENINKT